MASGIADMATQIHDTVCVDRDPRLLHLPVVGPTGGHLGHQGRQADPHIAQGEVQAGILVMQKREHIRCSQIFVDIQLSLGGRTNFEFSPMETYGL